jgi:hypothetical protein
MRQGVRPYADVNSHWSPEGPKLVADHLAVEFLRRGWLMAAPQGR